MWEIPKKIETSRTSGSFPSGAPQNGSDPFLREKKIIRVIGLMVFKLTDSASRFQHKNVSNFAGLVWNADFRHFFGNILGLGAYTSKQIFALKP